MQLVSNNEFKVENSPYEYHRTHISKCIRTYLDVYPGIPGIYVPGIYYIDYTWYIYIPSVPGMYVYRVETTTEKNDFRLSVHKPEMMDIVGI